MASGHKNCSKATTIPGSIFMGLCGPTLIMLRVRLLNAGTPREALFVSCSFSTPPPTSLLPLVRLLQVGKCLVFHTVATATWTVFVLSVPRRQPGDCSRPPGLHTAPFARSRRCGTLRAFMQAIGFLVLLMLVGCRSPKPHGILLEGVRCGDSLPVHSETKSGRIARA